MTETSEFDIRKFFRKIDVLDYGFIELIDGMISDPRLKIVNSARVSFNKESKELTDKDLKLIDYLYKHGHLSTFRHSYFTFRIKAPLFVFRQLWKYQIGSEWIENDGLNDSGNIQGPETAWSEMSGRYVEFEPEFYIPQEIRVQSTDNKQGSYGKLEKLKNGEDPVEFFKKSCYRQYKDYQLMVDSGAAKEQCRSLLPQNVYSQCIWTCSLQCILFVLHQRLPEDAQSETKTFAMALKDLIFPMLEPISVVI